MPKDTICHCQEGWVCETHPDKGWPDTCNCGAGMKCPNPECPWWKGAAPGALNTDDWDHVEGRQGRKVIQ